MKPSQLAFSEVVEAGFRSHEKLMLRYMAANVAIYRGFADIVKPSLSDSEQVFTRVAFAILSANAPFEDSVSALHVVVKHKGNTQGRALAPYRMVPAKATYCNRLWEICQVEHEALLKQESESWHEYRMRLKWLVGGLGMAKASFAACLLYPDEADLACVDTWVQKVFLGHSAFKQLSVVKYLEVEAWIRSYGVRFGVSTFIAQWLIWDHARGETQAHGFFPGSHK